MSERDRFAPGESEDSPGVKITDKRRIDPETGQVREPVVEGSVVDETGAEDLDAAAAELVADARVAELTADLQRVSAEYANYRKRVDRDREAVRELAVGSVLAELLPVLDDIERARGHGELEGALKAVGESLDSLASKLGLERFGTADEPFDPLVHEAISHEERDDLDVQTVTAVYQGGYRYAGRVLRPARVAVAGG